MRKEKKPHLYEKKVFEMDSRDWCNEAQHTHSAHATCPKNVIQPLSVALAALHELCFVHSYQPVPSSTLTVATLHVLRCSLYGNVPWHFLGQFRCRINISQQCSFLQHSALAWLFSVYFYNLLQWEQSLIHSECL